MATKAQLESEYYQAKNQEHDLASKIRDLEYKISRLKDMQGPNFDPSQEIYNLQGNIRDLQSRLSKAEDLAKNIASRLDRGDYDKPHRYD